MNPLTVAVPVGPHAEDQKWLDKCLESVRLQTRQPDEVLIIDDMAGLSQDLESDQPYPIRIWRSPWRLGVAHAFNFGVALAKNDLVFMLAADDWLEPGCLEACLEEYERQHCNPLGYYYVSVQAEVEEGWDCPYVLPDPPVWTKPCTAAMVTKQLWRHTGGYPLESGNTPDPSFVTLLNARQGAGHLYPVDIARPLYNSLAHRGQSSGNCKEWYGIAIACRNLLIRDWKPSEWGRYDNG